MEVDKVGDGQVSRLERIGERIGDLTPTIDNEHWQA
jgi:hypothetical protein